MLFRGCVVEVVMGGVSAKSVELSSDPLGIWPVAGFLGLGPTTFDVTPVPGLHPLGEKGAVSWPPSMERLGIKIVDRVKVGPRIKTLIGIE